MEAASCPRLATQIDKPRERERASEIERKPAGGQANALFYSCSRGTHYEQHPGDEQALGPQAS